MMHATSGCRHDGGHWGPVPPMQWIDGADTATAGQGSMEVKERQV